MQPPIMPLKKCIFFLYRNFEGCLEPTNPGVLLKKSAKFNFDQMILMLESPAVGFFHH